jgi:glycosyltransferase involved in cell wall biosynthesis
MTSPIEVAVNLMWLTPGRVGGSEEYLVRQLSGLASDGGVEPVLYCHHRFNEQHSELAARFRTVSMPFDRDSRVLRMGAEHTWFAARSRHSDVRHHGGGTAPVASRRPYVLTVHDLQYLAMPHHFSLPRRAYLNRLIPTSVRRAAVICTPTSFVRDTVIESFGIDDQRVVVVPHGVPDSSMPTLSEIGRVRRRYELGTSPYVVYPAITHPHKRHAVLVEMLAHTAGDLRLVLIGGRGSAEPELDQIITKSGFEDRITRPGRVSADDRDALIAGAVALVFPSEYEGFGAPLVEAMALDTPVVCASHAAMAEVVGDAGVVVEDVDPRAWAQAVERADGRRDELIELGRVRRQSFTPELSGVVLADAYRTAAGS